MKSFNKYNNYISLKGLDTNIIERLKNLNNKQINECCGCCCEPTCGDTISSRLFIRFYSEYEIINKLKTNVKVQDLFDIHRQLDNSLFTFNTYNEEMKDVFVPLYFKENGLSNLGGKLEQPSGTEYNINLYKFINSLVKDYKMTYPTILTLNDSTVQLFFVKGCGSNGKEGSIKSSLIELANLLDDLDSIEEITWSQILDASIDNIDDVYTFVVTCTVDINKF